MNRLGMLLLGMGMIIASIPLFDASAHAQQPPAANGAQLKELTLDLGNKMTLKLVQIPPGKFLMGSPATEKDRVENETQHEVTFSKPFYMGVTNVTVDQFATFTKETSYQTGAEKDGDSGGFKIQDGKYVMEIGVEGRSWRKPSFEQKGDHPVVQVNWNDATAFCDWLSKKSGKTVLLPTEAQWEYACRAGSKTAYFWGDNPDDGKGYVNAADQSLKRKLANEPASRSFFSWDDGFVFTSPVASFKPNAFGLYDMNGNVSQWCQDLYPSDVAQADKSARRVVRGGNWYANPRACRSAMRVGRLFDYQSDLVGFRVAVVEAE